MSLNESFDSYEPSFSTSRISFQDEISDSVGGGGGGGGKGAIPASPPQPPAANAPRKGQGQSSATMTMTQAQGILRSSGLDPKSPNIAALLNAAKTDAGNIDLQSVMQGPESPLKRALNGNLAIPEWARFKQDIEAIFNEVKKIKGGRNADYIPILAEADPDRFAVAITTVDGQQLVLGDADDDYSIQSCVKPLLYAVAASDLGLKKVHRHVGAEPSGLAFNEISLNADNLPHNSMINPGAIATAGLVGLEMEADERFRYFLDRVSAMAGGEHVGFSQQTYLCEQETAWRNNALMYYLHEAGVFPRERTPEDILDFYLQACSVEVNTKTAANIAATLAKGGTCPLTGEQCVAPQIIKAVLTIMFSAGMYDYSGEWCVHVGLPAKSGVAGLVYCVIPHVMGVAIWSPPLDSHGNSVKGVEFCKRLLARYKFGIFNAILSDSVMDAVTRPESAVTSAGGSLRRKHSLKRMASSDNMRLQALAHQFEALHTILVNMKLTLHAVRLIQALTNVSPSDEDMAAALVEEVLRERDGTLPNATHAQRKRFATIGFPLVSLIAYLRTKGLVPKRRLAPVLYSQMTRMLQHAIVIDSEVYLCAKDLILPGENDNLVLHALTRRLAMADFKGLCHDVKDIIELVKEDRDGEVSRYSKMVQSDVDADAFGVAICTCDGQIATFGDATSPVPLLDAVKPLLYGLALKDVGAATVHQYVGTEPTAADPHSFSLLKPSSHGGGDDEEEAEAKAEDPHAPKELRPYNPFMDSGALAVCSLLGRAHLPEDSRLFHDKGSRFTHIISHLTQWAGGRKIGFNNPVFLALKKRALKTLALSHYIKGMNCYPERTSPEDNANLYLQAAAIEPRPLDLAVIAATIANRGVCPTTRIRCMSRDDVRWTLSLMYNAGVNQFTGKWNFSVGIPASCGPSGLLMAVIPNVMGLVVYSPRVNAMGVPVRALRLCEMLTKRYRINMFDQLVYRDEEVRALPEPAKKQTVTETIMFFDLCMAASRGDIQTVKQLLEDGVDVNYADYDQRTALHIACSDGQIEVAKLLVKEGAEVLSQDRWGQTPYDDALRGGYEEILFAFDRVLRGARFCVAIHYPEAKPRGKHSH